MTINLNIQAEVIDIRTDTPKSSDIFFVDTNVWIWQTYGIPPESRPERQGKTSRKSRIYTGYLSCALSSSAQLKYSSLILAELAHVIEKAEFQIFKRSSDRYSLQAKEYRHSYPDERTVVAEAVQIAWSQVSALASSADLTIDAALGSTALERFQTQALDGYDLFLLEAISRTGVDTVQALTDDMDYACVPGIQVFTSNGLVIQQATAQGKLLERTRGQR